MAERGGKGSFSLGKGGKIPSFKNPTFKEVPLKAKDDDSAKSKKGRKVQFNNDGGKGGKNNGVKGSVPKEPAKYELNTTKDVPSYAQCLMDCEAADILEGVQEQMTFLSRDPTIKIPVSFDRGLQYAKSGGRYTNHESVRQVLGKLKAYGVSDGEICLIANVYPETSDEVFAQVTSLKGKRSKLTEPLNDVLAALAPLKISSAPFKV